MLHSSRDHNELTLFNPDVVVVELHTEAPFDHQEHFIFVFVMVKDKLTLDFVQLHHLPIEFGGNVRLPVFLNQCKLLDDVYLFHKLPQRNIHCVPADDDSLLSGVSTLTVPCTDCHPGRRVGWTLCLVWATSTQNALDCSLGAKVAKEIQSQRHASKSRRLTFP